MTRGSNRRSRRTSNCDSISVFNLGRMCWTGWPNRPICRCSRSLVPEGTFNYSDSHEYTPDRGHRRDQRRAAPPGLHTGPAWRLLIVMNLEDEVPDVLVEFVPVEKLDGRGEFELVKTVFHLAQDGTCGCGAGDSAAAGSGRKMIVMPKCRQIS